MRNGHVLIMDVLCISILVAVQLLAAVPASQAHVADVQHPDLPGLLALKATICGNCSDLHSWTPNGSVCSTFEGVYCGWIDGAFRVVGVGLQLDLDTVLLNDSAMQQPGGVLAGLPHLKELELLCVQQHARPTPPGPPGPTPTNTPLKQQQQQQQQQRQWQSLPGMQQEQQQQGGQQSQQQQLIEALHLFRWDMQHSASNSLQGLHVSRWLAATAADDDALTAAAAPTAAIDPAVATGAAGSTALHTPQPQQRPQQQQLLQEPAAVGELPYSWFRAYPRLTHLRVVGCNATGTLSSIPVSLGSLQHLASLVLSHNRLQGTLPDNFALLKGLTVLDVSANNLSGSLPTSWTRLQHLHYLYLNNNNLTGTLPCEYAQLQLRLADLSGNAWHSTPIGGDLECEGSLSLTAQAATSAAAAAEQEVAEETGAALTAGRTAAALDGLMQTSQGNAFTPRQKQQHGEQQEKDLSRRQQWRLLQVMQLNSSSSIKRSGSMQLHSAAAGALHAPRCWLRRYCYDEGAFICLQRTATATTAGCSSYVYGASDLHIDPHNQCDHGGSQLAGVGVMWAAFGAALLVVWLHHCRVMRQMHQPGTSNTAATRGSRGNQPSGPQGPWQQRQWLISGPSPTSRARARSIGAGAGAVMVHSGSGNTLTDPLLSQAPGTLPLLYHPATREDEGAGYSSPVSSGGAADMLDAAAVVGTPDALLPSALTTPSAGAISIRPQGPLLGLSSSRGRGVKAFKGGSSSSSRGLAAGAADKGSAAAAAGLGAAVGPGAMGSGRRPGVRHGSQQQEASGYDSDISSASAEAEVGSDGTGSGTATHLSGHWLKPDYNSYFLGNEPLPPWAGGVARLLAATLAPAGSSGSNGGGRGGSSGCLAPQLLVPLVALLLCNVTNLRLLIMWGVGPPAHVKLWPSYALLGLMLVPHVLVGAVVHFRLLAMACLPPALKAAAAIPQGSQLASQWDILPPGSSLVVRLYGWLFAAPAWLAYPLILLLLGPGVVLLTLLCPLVVVLAAFGLGSVGGVVRYVQLLQGCSAATQSAGSAGLLTVLFLYGNMPLEWAFLDSSLYFLTAAADLGNIAVALWLRLEALRQQQALALAALPTALGQQWT